MHLKRLQLTEPNHMTPLYDWAQWLHDRYHDSGYRIRDCFGGNAGKCSECLPPRLRRMRQRRAEDRQVSALEHKRICIGLDARIVSFIVASPATNEALILKLSSSEYRSVKPIAARSIIRGLRIALLSKRATDPTPYETTDNWTQLTLRPKRYVQFIPMSIIVAWLPDRMKVAKFRMIRNQASITLFTMS